MLIGIVGKPSAGKSTFFSALTQQEVEIANYPFTTIEPQRGAAYVRVECAEKQFNVKCNPRSGHCEEGVRFVPVELLDVAGLVPGASEGKGMGNQFLNDLSRADALIHVVDASGSLNEKGEPIGEGNYDPVKDVAFLETEINAWMYGILKKNWGKFYRVPITEKNKKIELLQKNLSGLGVTEEDIGNAMRKADVGEKSFNEWSEENQKMFIEKLREEAFPIVIAANKCDLPKAKENIKKLKEAFPEKTIIACSAASERSLKRAAKDGFISYVPGDKHFEEKKELTDAQKKGLAIIQKEVLDVFEGTGVQKVLEDTVFNVLEYFPVFPGSPGKLEDSQGRILADCFLLPKGSRAIDFAFKLHSDIGNGFIKAIDAKTKQAVGKDHPLKAGDVIEIVFKKP